MVIYDGNTWQVGDVRAGTMGGRANEYLYTYNNKPDSGSAVAFQKNKEIR